MDDRKMALLNQEEGDLLLAIARKGLQTFVDAQTVYEPDLALLPPALTRPGTSFVTLTNRGMLRGCLGSTEPRTALARDVACNAASAASRDPRFPPVLAEEVPDIKLEVTVLTPARPLPYANYDDLLARLRPGVDGVILAWQQQRALLLPQVWDRIPDPAKFLGVLCQKGSIPGRELSRVPPTINVFTFQAQSFPEPGYREPGTGQGNE